MKLHHHRIWEQIWVNSTSYILIREGGNQSTDLAIWTLASGICKMIQNLILLQIHMYRVFFGPLVVSTETENNLQKELHGRLADLQVD